VKELLLSEEKRTGRDEPAIAHAPEMAGDARGSGNASAHQHAEIPRRRQQNNRAAEEIHHQRNSRLSRDDTHSNQDGAGCHGGRDGRPEDESAPIEDAGIAAAAPSRQPCGREHVQGQQSTKKVVRLMYPGRQHRSTCAHGHHRHNKHISCYAMPARALAVDHSDRARQQPNHSACNVKN